MRVAEYSGLGWRHDPGIGWRNAPEHAPEILFHLGTFAGPKQKLASDNTADHDVMRAKLIETVSKNLIFSA